AVTGRPVATDRPPRRSLLRDQLRGTRLLPLIAQADAETPAFDVVAFAIVAADVAQPAGLRHLGGKAEAELAIRSDAGRADIERKADAATGGVELCCGVVGELPPQIDHRVGLPNHAGRRNGRADTQTHAPEETVDPIKRDRSGWNAERASARD